MRFTIHDSHRNWQEFDKGNFCVNKTEAPFCGIGVDHAIEHVNRMMKVKGGLCGITLKPAAMSRFFLAAPEMARINEKVQKMVDGTSQKNALHPNSQEKHFACIGDCIPYSNIGDIWDRHIPDLKFCRYLNLRGAYP